MQQAIPKRAWPPAAAATTSSLESQLSDSSSKSAEENYGTINSTNPVTKMVSENAVIAFGRRGCCMCHVVKQLLLGLGVNPTIFFFDEEDEEAIMEELSRIAGDNNGKVQFPAVFVGGKLFGGLERVMATHITGELVPMLIAARALWL